MTPEHKELLKECLLQGNSELCDQIFTGLQGDKGDIAFLKAFIAGEKKKRVALKRQHLISDAEFQIQRLENKAKHTKTALSVPAKPAARRAEVEVVTDNDAMDLASIETAIHAEHEQISRHLEAAKDAALPHMLRIGLQCLKAQALFGLTDPGKRGQGRKPKEIMSEADMISGHPPEEPSQPASFSDWIGTEAVAISRPNAYNYMKAVKGLDLDHEATDKQLDKALAAARKAAGEQRLSIAKLAHLGSKKEAPAEEEEDEIADPNSPEARAGEARTFVADWISRWDQGLKAGNLEDLDPDGLRQMEEFLRNTLDHIKRRLKGTKPDKAA